MSPEADAAKPRAVWPALLRQSILCVKLLCPRACVRGSLCGCVYGCVQKEQTSFIKVSSDFQLKQQAEYQHWTKVKARKQKNPTVWAEYRLRKKQLFLLTLARKTHWHYSLEREMICSSNLSMTFLSQFLVVLSCYMVIYTCAEYKASKQLSSFCP